MKPRTILCLVLCLTLTLPLLAGCSLLRNRAEQLSQSNREAEKDQEEVTEEVLACFDAHDAEGLKAILSPKTQEMENIDTQIEEAMSFFEGAIVSYDDYLGGSEGSSSERGITVEQDRFWRIKDIATDAGKIYEIQVTQYVKSESVPDRVGVAQLAILLGEAEVVIGFDWPDYTALAKWKVENGFGYLRRGANVGDYFCEKTMDLPEYREQRDEAEAFIEGVSGTGYGEGEGNSRRGITTSLEQQVDVEGGEAVRVYLEITAENIRTDAGKKYTLQIFMYEINLKDPSLEGVMQAILTDEDGNSCTVGENFHTA